MFADSRSVKQRRWLVVWIGAVGSLAAARPSTADIYMHSSSTEMMFLRLSARERDFLGGNLTGDFQSVALDDRYTDGLHVLSSGVSGAIRGGTLEIDLDEASLFGSSQLYGAYTPKGISLKIPTNSGRIESLAFTRATEAQWNGRLERLREVGRWRKYATDLDRAFGAARNDASGTERQIDSYQARLRADGKQWERATQELWRQQQRLAEAARERSEAADVLQTAAGLVKAAEAVAGRCPSASDVTAVERAKASVKEVGRSVNQAADEVKALASAIQSGSGGRGYLGIATSSANQVLSDALQKHSGVTVTIKEVTKRDRSGSTR